ncbi:YCF48-related protein [Myxosarcina sp. GI1]|uniref:WD40/YVTN/BNR-like repeat-containing protein n=1 Tax=Myxosarcina sp. GI1 TaxID=1541065 RepID=UPI000692138E|nr:YCF48-related protein [Myxosarcina sp. GI1]
MFLPQFNWLKVTILSLLLTVATFGFNVRTALAHYPHDDIFAVEISPNYQQDRTLFTNVRGNLLKSQDGGDSWQTIVNGLDYRHQLSSLAIATSSPKVLFLSTSGDGIYKSEDEGNSWFKVDRGLDNLNIELVAIAPDAVDLVLATGTERGLYKTDNGGASWESLTVGNQNKITALAFAPHQSESVIVGDELGQLYLSKDSGENWQQLTSLKDSGAINTIAISPNFATDGIFWLGTEDRGIFKTVDGGVFFTPANQGLKDSTIMSLAVAPDSETTLLASTWHQGVFRSNDGGKSWQQSSKGLTTDAQADRPGFNRPHFSDLSVSQTFNQDRTVFAAGFDGLFKSTDGGRVWQELSTLSPNIIVGLDISPDYQHDSTIAVTTYLGGAYLSGDRGDTWTTINKGLEKDSYLKRTAKRIAGDNYVARLFGLEFSPNYSQDKTLFSPSWTYFLKSTDRGENWQKLTQPNKPKPFNRPTKYSVAVSPNFAADRTIYLGSMQGSGQDAILRSTDGGRSFSVVGNIEGKPVAYLVISPDFATDKTLYAGTVNGVYKTVDTGSNWQLVSQGIPSSQDIIKLAISPNYQSDRTVVAGTTEGLFITKDGATSWTQLPLTDGSQDYIEAVAISPNYGRDRTLIINVRGKGLFKTADGGTTFERVGADLARGNRSLANMDGFWPPVVPIQFSPNYERDRTIYGVAEAKLFRSTDGGNTWTDLPLPQPQASSAIDSLTYNYFRLTVSPAFKFLAAAIVALLGYLVLGRLRLEKKLPFRRIQIRAGGVFITFVAMLMLLSAY